METSKKEILKKRIMNSIAILIVVGGLVILGYPIISNQMYQDKQKNLQDYYEAQVQQIEEKQKSEMWEECYKYNNELINHTVKLTDPFVEEQLTHAVHPYIDLLNPDGSGAMGALEVPAINLRLMIYHNTDETVLAKGVGHLQGSSLPVGGTGTHAVLTGHTGSASKELFTNLDQLQVGDVFYLHILDDTLAYQVDQIVVVLPEDTEKLMIDRDEDYVTLVTCTPYGINSHRLLVRGKRIPYESAKIVEEAQGKSGSTWWKQYLFAMFIGIAIVMVIYAIWKMTRKRGKKNGKNG